MRGEWTHVYKSHFNDGRYIDADAMLTVGDIRDLRALRTKIKAAKEPTNVKPL